MKQIGETTLGWLADWRESASLAGRPGVHIAVLYGANRAAAPCAINDLAGQFALSPGFT